MTGTDEVSERDDAVDTTEIDIGLESLKGFLAKLLQAVLGFAGTIVFARMLGPTDFGGFYFLLAMIHFATTPLVGVSEALKKRYSEPGVSGRRMFGAAMLPIGGYLACALGAVFVFRGLLIAETNVVDAHVVAAALFVAFAVFYPAQKMLGGAGWIGKQTWNDTLRSVLTIAFQLAFVLAGFGAAGMGYGLAGATLLVVPVALFYLRLLPSLPRREDLRSLWDFARYSIPGMLVGQTYRRFDLFLLGAILTTGTVGHYEVAYKLTLPATFLPTVVSSTLMPKVSGLASTGRDVTADVVNAASYTGLLAVPIFFGALALAEPLVVTVYGPPYRQAAPMLVGLALYQVLRSQVFVWSSTLSGIDRPDLGLRIGVGVLVFNVVLGIALIYEIGAIGVVIATVVAEFLRYVLLVYVVGTQIGSIDYVPRPLVEQFVAGVMMFVVVWQARGFVSFDAWSDLAGLVLLGAVAYAAVLVSISSGFRTTLLSVGRRAIG